ncbi:hypothetical protein KKF91_20340 [Myxococcota bacterium]|nr:hypothetical protein [Myxococcota bacterium]MBU1432896.1 hypothetical protein [Myxococcota bacterium]MBU1900142.1 hypothetical protein [Myxococcota bacterium]
MPRFLTNPSGLIQLMLKHLGLIALAASAPILWLGLAEPDYIRASINVFAALSLAHLGLELISLERGREDPEQ